jgi:excisionase family DNA binding protein
MGYETQTQQRPNGNEPEGFITKEEVAKRLKKTVRTVENWQRKGILPFVKAERSVLFRWSDVVGHLECSGAESFVVTG